MNKQLMKLASLRRQLKKRHPMPWRFDENNSEGFTIKDRRGVTVLEAWHPSQAEGFSTSAIVEATTTDKLIGELIVALSEADGPLTRLLNDK